MKTYSIFFPVVMIAINSLSIFSMEKPCLPACLSPIKEEDVQVRLDVLRALTNGVLNQDNDENIEPGDLNVELLKASPQSFCKRARSFVQEYLDEQYKEKGITPEMRQAHEAGVEYDIKILSYADEDYSPAPSPIKKEVLEVAKKMKLADLDVRRGSTGHTAYARSNRLVYDPACVEQVAPTPRRRKALWAHELTHLQENDLAQRLALERAFKHADKTYSPETKGQQSRFFEVFADAGACKSPQSTQAALQLAKKNAEFERDGSPDEHHPAVKRRVKIIESIEQFYAHYPEELKRKEERERRIRTRAQQCNAALDEALLEAESKK